MPFRHAIVWIDHKQAHIVQFNPETSETVVIHGAGGHLHHKSGAIGSGHAADDQHFLHSVAEALRNTAEILVVGPGNAKLALIKHLMQHDKAISDRVVGIETVDHPTDAQLLAYARKHFVSIDNMLGDAV